MILYNEEEVVKVEHNFKGLRTDTLLRQSVHASFQLKEVGSTYCQG
jgi:hypothetical protein